MRIILAGDHAGFSYKKILLDHLQANSYKVEDTGAFSEESCDYPDFIHPAAEKIVQGFFDFGVFFCGSANGVAITANKHRDIRAAICWNNELAELARLHNNANVICIPCRFVSLESTIEMVDLFIQTKFEGGRHERRVSKIPC
ncbi:MAG: RpiB/LacA/LacB family sugar-phosphate isomerase [Chitinophagales bacterium]|nr:RpiB/LacA/LacB family sugar-phosphate isomerase [Chitinophagales bacterium]